MSRIVCFGEALIDFLAQPAATADAPRAFLQYAGGAPANVAVAARRLGADCDFVGMLGEDLFGDFLLQSLTDAGVGTRFIRRTAEAKTALAFVALDAHGERSFSFYRPPAADLLFREADFDRDCFSGAGLLHLCSNSLTAEAIAATTLTAADLAHRAGAVVSVDLNLRPALWPADTDPQPRLWQLLLQADIVKLARDELDYLAAGLGSEAAVLDRLWRGRLHWLIVTDGGGAIQWQTRQASASLPAFRVAAIDTTAAGDAFVGGLLAHLASRAIELAGLPGFVANRDTVEAALREAAAAGALAVTRHGAFAAMPSRAELDRFLQEQA